MTTQAPSLAFGYRQLTQTREIDVRPVEQIERLPNATTTWSYTAVVCAVEQQLEIRPLLVDNLIHERRRVGARALNEQLIGTGGRIAVEDVGRFIGTGADVVCAKFAVVAAGSWD